MAKGLTLRPVLELVGNYPPNEFQIGTNRPIFCSYFKQAELELYPLFGLEAANPCPLICKKHEKDSTHEHIEAPVGGCLKDCDHKQDDSGPNDKKWSFTVTLEGSQDGKTWKVLGSHQLSKKEHFPVDITVPLKHEWIRLMVKSNNVRSNADILIQGHLILTC